MKKEVTTFLLILFAITSTFAQQTVEDEKKPASIYFNNGKLTFESKDKAFKLWFDNRIYLDAAYYSPTQDVSGLSSKLNKDLEEDDGQFRFNNGVIVRRARFGIKGTLYNNWFAELDIDLAYNEIEIKDMLIGYKFSDKITVRAGNFKEPMSMERLTSSKYLTNMERPMVINMFAGGRKLGVAATAWDKHWWVSGGIFGSEVTVLQKEKNRGSDGYGFTGRAAVSPILRDDMVLHIGGYATYRTPSALG
ncbi:MAG: porin, partial [Phocaeicola sp.]